MKQPQGTQPPWVSQESQLDRHAASHFLNERSELTFFELVERSHDGDVVEETVLLMVAGTSNSAQEGSEWAVSRRAGGRKYKTARM
jgi:hypothetical protein